MYEKQHYIALSSLLRKEVRRFLRIWLQTLVPPTITMSLYFVIFGSLIGSRVGRMDGFSYIDYIVPGIIMMSVITNSYSNVVSSFFSAKFQKFIEELLVSPVPTSFILFGYVGGGMARGILTGFLVTLVAGFFTDLNIQNYSLVFLVIALTSALFSLGGLINGIFARKFDDASIVPTFILTPLTYLGGVFYSIKLLPEFWQKLSMANPILYMVNAFRFGFLGASDIPLEISLMVIVGFCVILMTFAYFLLAKGVGIRE